MLPDSVLDDPRAGVLELAWPDGVVQRLSHPFLRGQCKCTMCESNRRRGQESVPDAEVRIREIRPVGVYALQLIFSDGHERGIFPWELLCELNDHG